MKIALLTPTYSSFSGIDRLVEQKAEELHARGDKVTIYALSADMKPKHAELRVIGMPKSLFWQRVYRLLFFLDRAKIKKYAGELAEYELAISFFYPMNIIACEAKKRHGVKYVAMAA